jgi:integrase
VLLKGGLVRWRFRVDVGEKPRTRNGQPVLNGSGRPVMMRDQRTYTFDTQKEARDARAAIVADLAKGTYVKPTKTGVNEFLDSWLASVSRDIERATASNYGHALIPVRERLGYRVLQSLVEADIEGLVDWMLASGRRRGGTPGTSLSVRSVRLTLGRLRTALNAAVRQQLVLRNVALFVTIPRSAVKAEAAGRVARTPWTQDEVRAFLSGIRDERLYPVLLLSLMGLRPAEVCGLRWVDVDLAAGTIAVGENTRTLVDGQIDEKGAKSVAGRRLLPLPKTVADALKAFHKAQAAEKLQAGEAYRATGYVLVDEHGEPVRTDWLRRQAHRLMAKVGVRTVRLYEARHACLTYLGAIGVPDVVIAAWAGHADGGTLAKHTYIHPDITHLTAAARRLDAGLLRSGGSK